MVILIRVIRGNAFEYLVMRFNREFLDILWKYWRSGRENISHVSSFLFTQVHTSNILHMYSSQGTDKNSTYLYILGEVIVHVQMDGSEVSWIVEFKGYFYWTSQHARRVISPAHPFVPLNGKERAEAIVYFENKYSRYLACNWSYLWRWREA